VTLSSEGARTDAGGPDEPATLAQREVDIATVPDLAWDLQVRVNDWPSWHPGIIDSLILEGMGPGVKFSWVEGDRALTARVEIFREGSALSWSALDGDVTLIQYWTFTPIARGVHVSASEMSWGEGPGDASTARLLAGEQSLDTWLAHLKAEAEART
jgi:hypothetical protein